MRWLIVLAILLGVIVIVGPLALVSSSTSPTATPSQTIAPTETVTITPTSTATPPSGTTLVVVEAWALNVRACPGIGCAIVGTLSKGDVVTTTHEQVTLDDGAVWWRVETGTETGWVNSKYLSPPGGKNERK